MCKRFEGHASVSTALLLVATLTALTFASCKKDNTGPGSSGPGGRQPILDQTLYGWETIGIIPRKSSGGTDHNITSQGIDFQIAGDQRQVMYVETYHDQLFNTYYDYYKATLGGSLNDAATVAPIPYVEQHNSPGSGTNQAYNYRYGFVDGQYLTYQGSETDRINGGFSSATMSVRVEPTVDAIPPINCNDGTFGVPYYFSDRTAFLTSQRFLSGAQGFTSDNSLRYFDGRNWNWHYQIFNFDYTHCFTASFSAFHCRSHIYSVRRFYQVGQHTEIQVLDTAISQSFAQKVFKPIARIRLSEIGDQYGEYDGYSASKTFGDKTIILVSQKGILGAYSWMKGDSVLHELYSLTGITDLESGDAHHAQKLENFAIGDDGSAYALKGPNGAQVVKYSAQGVTPLGKEIPFVNYGMNNLHLIDGYLYAAVGPRQNVADKDQQLDIVRIKL